MLSNGKFCDFFFDLPDAPNPQHVIGENGTFPAMNPNGTGFTVRRTTSGDERTSTRSGATSFSRNLARIFLPQASFCVELGLFLRILFAYFGSFDRCSRREGGTKKEIAISFGG